MAKPARDHQAVDCSASTATTLRGRDTTSSAAMAADSQMTDQRNCNAHDARAPTFFAKPSTAKLKLTDLQKMQTCFLQIIRIGFPFV